jgi:poly [ADP-ribose] polymerase
MSLGSSAKPIEPILTTIAKKEYMPSQLDPNVQDFVKLIFNTSLMEQSVVNIGYDAKKMPLGELSKETVLRGYKILNEIEDVL